MENKEKEQRNGSMEENKEKEQRNRSMEENKEKEQGGMDQWRRPKTDIKLKRKECR